MSSQPSSFLATTLASNVSFSLSFVLPFWPDGLGKGDFGGVGCAYREGGAGDGEREMGFPTGLELVDPWLAFRDRDGADGPAGS
jgi:hypothetical protein